MPDRRERGRYIYRAEDFIGAQMPAYENLIGIVTDQIDRIRRNRELRREESIREEERAFQLQLFERRMDFQRGERMAGEAFQEEQAQLDRQAEIDQNFLNRQVEWAKIRADILKTGTANEQELFKKLEEEAKDKENAISSRFQKLDDAGFRAFAGGRNFPINLEVAPNLDTNEFETTIGFGPDAEAVSYDAVAGHRGLLLMEDFNSYLNGEHLESWLNKIPELPEGQFAEAPMETLRDTVFEDIAISTPNGQYQDGEYVYESDGDLYATRTFMRNQLVNLVRNWTDEEAINRGEKLLNALRRGELKIPSMSDETSRLGITQKEFDNARNNAIKFNNSLSFLQQDMPELHDQMLQAPNEMYPRFKEQQLAGGELLKPLTIGHYKLTINRLINAGLANAPEDTPQRNEIMERLEQYAGSASESLESIEKLATIFVDRELSQDIKLLKQYGYLRDEIINALHFDPRSTTLNKSFYVDSSFMESVRSRIPESPNTGFAEEYTYSDWLRSETGFNIIDDRDLRDAYMRLIERGIPVQ